MYTVQVSHESDWPIEYSSIRAYGTGTVLISDLDQLIRSSFCIITRLMNISDSIRSQQSEMR